MGEGLGAGKISLVAEPLRESHEKLIPSLRGAGVGEGVGTVGVAFGARGGGGPHGIEGRFPESPWPLKGNLGGEVAISFSVDMLGAEPDLIEAVSVAPSSWTSSREVAEILCAVSSGDLAGISSLCGSASWSSESMGIEFPLCARGVETVDDGRPLVKERTEFDDSCDCGLDAVSGASSKVSYPKLARSTRLSFVTAGILGGYHTPSLSELSAL